MNKPTRGGKRAGAGRKSREFHGKLPLKAITVRIEPEVKDNFKTICKDNGRSQPEQITEWVRNACALRALELYKEDRNCEHGGSARSKLELEFGVEVVREMLSNGIENNLLAKVDKPIHRGKRCRKCAWALYDGHIGQNPACECWGKKIEGEDVIMLSNDEVQSLTSSSQIT